MGLFDFPRIHFSGNVDINVPTINNAYYFPLTIYDQVRSIPFLPPRLYFETEEQITSVTPSIQPEIISDELNGYKYIEINTVQDIPTLRQWLQTKIQDDGNPLNKDYIAYYKKAETVWNDTEGTTLMGKVIGYWNMWGDMGVKMSEVNVTGVQTYANGVINSYNKDTPTPPIDITSMLNASVDFDTAPRSGTTTASMVETISSQSIYANIFCSNINFYNSENTSDIMMQGTPYRFSASIYGANRVPEWPAPGRGSARFVSSIPLEALQQDKSTALLNFFNNNKAYDGRQIKGIFVTFQTFEVFENRYDQDIYQENKEGFSNPAQATTVGSITPWYDGDMKTTITGRQLISLDQNPVNISGGFLINPVMTSLTILGPASAIFSVDFGNSWPEQMDPPFASFPAESPPAKRGDANFKTLDMGVLSFRLGSNASSEFYSVEVSSLANPRSSVFQKGCIFDIVLTDPIVIENIQNQLISVYLIYPPTTGTTPQRVLSESPYLIVSDQKGCYGEEGDLASDGYVVYDQNKESCILRIFEKGVPLSGTIPIYLAKWKAFEAANDPIKPAEVSGPFAFSDGQLAQLNGGKLQLDMDDNAIYYFIYENQYPKDTNGLPKVPPYAGAGYTIMDTGSFICLRVHKNKDTQYAKYYNPVNWGTTPPNFQIVYEEVFKLYDVVYPLMAFIHPFKEEIWNNPMMAGLVLQRTDPAIWNGILYMPKSRELSRSQRKLLEAWNRYLNTNHS